MRIKKEQRANKLFRTVSVILFGLISSVALNNYNVYESNLEKRLKIEESQRIKVLTKDEEWSLFTEAIIWKESRGDEKAIGDEGKAVGVLQIWPIMVREANRISKLKKNGQTYTYDDRLDRDKSIEIFNVVQEYHNKDKDFQKALDIWNQNHPASYCNAIMKKFNELKENALS